MTPKPVNNRLLIKLQDPSKQSNILRPDGSRVLDPIGTVLYASDAITQCKVGDEVAFSNTENVLTAPQEVFGERMYFVKEEDLLCILQPHFAELPPG